MDIRKLKFSADESLAAASYPPKRLVLIHTGATLILSLVLILLSRILASSMDSTGGLSGMDTQSALSTAQIVLQILSMAVVPFWSAGLMFAAIGYARRQSVTADSLLEGFRRWKPILSSTLLVGTQYLGIGFISMYVSSAIFMLTPFAAPLYEAALQVTQDATLEMYALLGESLTGTMTAYMVIFLIVYAVLALPIYYRYRMVTYLILDEPKMGGLQAIFTSRLMMRHRRIKLFKLDLSFWWFYALELLTSLLCFGDTILAALGIAMPVSEDVAYWFFQILAMVGQLALYAWAKPKLETAYALAYESFCQPEEHKPQTPKSHPWNY